jgi:predicted nucleotidyltransferase
MRMDLSRPLAVVTPTLDAAVLAALAATTGWASGAQVHRLGGAGSPDGVRRVLARLVHQGIVLADEHPHATLYALNRDHVAADAVVALTRLRAVVIERVTDAVARAPQPVLHASLFGSFARGEATADSDIDILVVFDGDDVTPPDDRAAFLDELATGVRRWTGNHADVVVATPAVLAEMVAADDPLVASWRVDHVHLAGARLLDLLRRAS